MLRIVPGTQEMLCVLPIIVVAVVIINCNNNSEEFFLIFKFYISFLLFQETFTGSSIKRFQEKICVT